MEDCIFCKIAKKEIPADILYEDDTLLAFWDISPQAPVHFLVIPREHIESVAAVNAENSFVVAKIFERIALLAGSLGLKEGFRVVSNTGEQAKQTVKHLHFHVLSGRDMTWPPG